MGWQPTTDGGTGASPDRDSGLSGRCARDSRLARFADGPAGLPASSGQLALLADELSGPERRCPGATDNELIGLLQSWAAVESWAAAAKLGVIRELMRREGAPSPGAGHGDLPETWSASLRHELATALACSVQSAETTAWLAWEQQARLPGIGALLGDGTLTHAKARAVVEAFRPLTDADAASAEALIVDQLAGKSYPQVLRLAERAALTVDPDLATRRREQAQRQDARVTFFRELAGTAGLSGRDLPPDEALAAMASVNARADHYRDSGEFGDSRMDVLRAYAYLDLLNGVAAEARIASAEPRDDAAEAAEALAWAQRRAAARATAGAGPGSDDDAKEAGVGLDDSPEVRDGLDSDDGQGGSDGPGSDGPGSGGPGSGGPGGGSPGGGSPGPSPAGPTPDGAGRPRPADLIVPLATLLGLAERPGEVQGFGPVDPALARALAEAAAVSPLTEVCMTVTSPEGYAIAHGCARPARQSRPGTEDRAGPGALARLPARLQLTIPAVALAVLARQPGSWAFAPRGSPEPPGRRDAGGFGTWTLLVPGGRSFTVRLDPVPVFECDHRYESSGYQPSGRLRHLVQVRDGSCTFPSCNRHARESDFEHALPYDKGGKTCACNAGARSRACHRVKQSPGWRVTQPQPGWHQWTTPSGRVYIQEPKRYPA